MELCFVRSESLNKLEETCLDRAKLDGFDSSPVLSLVLQDWFRGLMPCYNNPLAENIFCINSPAKVSGSYLTSSGKGFEDWL